MRVPDSWDSVFLAMASAIARRSKDPSTQHGAVIVSSRHEIIACGFNGPPPGYVDGSVPWTERPGKYAHVMHAEINAIRYALRARGWQGIADCTLYVTGRPCSKCVLHMVAEHLVSVRFGDRESRCVDVADWELSCDIARRGGLVLTPVSGGTENFRKLD